MKKEDIATLKSGDWVEVAINASMVAGLEDWDKPKFTKGIFQQLCEWRMGHKEPYIIVNMECGDGYGRDFYFWPNQVLKNLGQKH